MHSAAAGADHWGRCRPSSSRDFAGGVPIHCATRAPYRPPADCAAGHCVESLDETIKLSRFMANVKVPYLDLKTQYQSIKTEVGAAIARVLDSCQVVLGSEVAAFEQDFAKYCGTAECIALNSGTSA